MEMFAETEHSILAFTEHISRGSSRFLFEIDWRLFLGLQFIDFFEILAILISKVLLQNPYSIIHGCILPRSA